jgi:hypothetical protein
MTATWLVRRYGGIPLRSALLALAALSVVSTASFVIRTAPFAWAADVHRNLSAARALLDGTFGTVEGYLYSPVAAALMIPALAVPEGWAVVGWLILKLAVLLAGTLWASRGLDSSDRFLAFVAVVGFLPVLHDLELGNVTIIVAASIAAVVWLPDRVATGVLLGIVLATAPKPGLVPVLFWMALFRPRALAEAFIVAGLAIIATWIFVGTSPFVAWIAALQAPPNLISGNFSLSGLPTLPAIVASVATIVATVLAVRRGPVPGLLAALACGLLVSPYTILYAATILVVALPAVARAAPRTTLLLALTAPVGLILAFPLWVGCLLPLAITIAPNRSATAGQAGVLAQ